MGWGLNAHVLKGLNQITVYFVMGTHVWFAAGGCLSTNFHFIGLCSGP
jgi:hypothetical protein